MSMSIKKIFGDLAVKLGLHDIRYPEEHKYKVLSEPTSICFGDTMVTIADIRDEFGRSGSAVIYSQFEVRSETEFLGTLMNSVPGTFQVDATELVSRNDRSLHAKDVGVAVKKSQL